MPTKPVNAQDESRAPMQNTAVDQPAFMTAPTLTTITPVQQPVVFQPQPQCPILPAQFEQQLVEQSNFGQQEFKSYQMPQQADSMDYTAPADPAPTPSPEEDAHQQASTRAQPEFDQGYFGIIDYSQFAFGVDADASYDDPIGQLPDNLDDLFADLEKRA